MYRSVAAIGLAFLVTSTTAQARPDSQSHAQLSPQERVAQELADIHRDSKGPLGEGELTRLVKSAGADRQAYTILRLAVQNGRLSHQEDQAFAQLREEQIRKVIYAVSNHLDVRIGRFVLPSDPRSLSVPITQRLYAFSRSPSGEWRRAVHLDTEVVRHFQREWKERHRFLPLSALGISNQPGEKELPDPRLQRIQLTARTNQEMEIPATASIAPNYMVIEPGSGYVNLSPKQRELELLGFLTTSPSFAPLQREQARAAAVRGLLMSADIEDPQKLGRLQLECWRDALALYHLAMVEHLGHHGFWRDYARFNEEDRELLNEGLLGQLVGVSQETESERATLHATLELSLQLQGLTANQIESQQRRLFGPLALWLLTDAEASEIGFNAKDFSNLQKRRAWIDRLSNEQLSRARQQHPILARTFIEKVVLHTVGSNKLPTVRASDHDVQEYIVRYVSSAPSPQQAGNRKELIEALRWVGLGPPETRVCSEVLGEDSTSENIYSWVHTVDFVPSNEGLRLVTRLLSENEVYDILEGSTEDPTTYSDAIWEQFLQFQAKSGSLSHDAPPLKLVTTSVIDESGKTLAQSATIVGESSKPVVEVVDSGPCDNGYICSSACRTKAWVQVKAPGLNDLQTGDRMRLWLQWSPTLEGPWKTRARGEIRVDSSGVLRTRGNLSLDQTEKEGVYLHVGPLAHSRWPTGTTPYFRVAQATKHPGEEWVRVPKRSLSPEDNNAVFAAPFQAAFGIVFVAADEAQLEQSSWDEVFLPALDDGTTQSYTHPFHLGLGGTNHASMLPGQKFIVLIDDEQLELWSYHDQPKGYRRLAAAATPPWGVCPLHVAQPEVGSSTTITVSTHFFGREYTRQFTVLGPEATPKNLENHRLDQQRYELINASKQSTTDNQNELLLAYKRAYTRYSDDVSDQTATALAQTYLPLLPLEQKQLEAAQDRLWNQAAPCAKQLRAAALAMQLCQWKKAEQHLQKAIQEHSLLVQQEHLTPRDSAQLFLLTLPVKSHEPFSRGYVNVRWLDLWKDLANAIYRPDLYEHALRVKLTIANQPISPEEYQTLAHLIAARTGNRVQAANVWQQAEELYHDPSSPFYEETLEENSLLALRPGWWPVD